MSSRSIPGEVECQVTIGNLGHLKEQASALSALSRDELLMLLGCAGWGGFSIPLKQPKMDEVGVDFISRIIGNWIHSKWGFLEFPDYTRKVHSVGEYESLTYQKVD